MFSIWEKETLLAPQAVIIVGSGFVGLWSALQFKKRHPKKKDHHTGKGADTYGCQQP